MNYYIQRNKGLIKSKKELELIGSTFEDWVHELPIPIDKNQLSKAKEYPQYEYVLMGFQYYTDGESVIGLRENPDPEVWSLLSEELKKIYFAGGNMSKSLLSGIEEEPSLENTISYRLLEFNNYAESDVIQSFEINSKNYPINKDEINDCTQLIQANEELGQENISIIINGDVFEMSIQAAKKMIAGLRLYINQCDVVTASHIANIKKLESIEEIETYNFIQGYPEKLKYNI